MDIGELTNTPVEVELAGRKFKARRPRLKDLFAAIEADIRAAGLREVKQAADEFGFKGPERFAFLSDQFAALPRGAKLQGEVWARMQTPEGVVRLMAAALRPDQPDLDDATLESMVQADSDAALALVEMLTGSKKKAVTEPEPEPVPDSAPTP